MHDEGVGPLEGITNTVGFSMALSVFAFFFFGAVLLIYTGMHVIIDTSAGTNAYAISVTNCFMTSCDIKIKTATGISSARGPRDLRLGDSLHCEENVCKKISR